MGSRKDSNGSAIIAPPFGILGTKRVASADEQRFGCVDRASRQLRNLRNGQPVEIAEGQRRTMVRAEPVQHLTSTLSVEPLLHVLLERLGRVDEMKAGSSRSCRRQ